MSLVIGLTTTRTTKRPHKKWASADQKRKAERESAEWEQLQAKLRKEAPRFSNRPTVDSNMPRGAFKPLSLSPAYPPGREPNNLPSRPDTPGTIAARKEDKVYTGTAMKGIGTLHKSNAVPVFTDEEAIDMAHMRR